MKIRRTVLIAEAVIIAILIAFLGVKLYFKNLVYTTIRTEAGSAISADDFVVKVVKEVSFTDKYEAFDVYTPGVYPVQIKNGLFKNYSKLVVNDTIPPTASGCAISLHRGETCKADVFVDLITDVCPVSVSFAKQPDFDRPGSQDVDIILKDTSGNEAIVSTGLYITDVEKEINVKIGEPVPTVEKFVRAARNAYFRDDYSWVDTSDVGNYVFIVVADGWEYECSFNVVDDVPPVFEVQNIESYTNTVWEASEFVTMCDDKTEVTFTFEKEPDNLFEGTQELVIVGTDKGGNQSRQAATLTLGIDTESPVISGVKNRVIPIGDVVTYMEGVTVTDNCEKNLIIDVDNSAVDATKEGTYKVIYTAIDASGNSVQQTAYFSFLVEPYSDYNINSTIEQIYKKIITDDMDDLQRLRAIYDYVHNHVVYSSYLGLGHEDRNKAIYYAVNKCAADCYGFATTAQALLDYGGFDSFMIEKVKLEEGMPTHFWNLVNIGDGYYHFDTCYRKDQPEIFMWNDMLMMLYSNKHNYCHNYDKARYTINQDGDIYAFMYGEDYERPPFVYGTGLENYFANGGSIEKYYGLE